MRLLPSNLEQAREIVQAPLLAIDTETTGLDWHKSDRPFAIIIASEKGVVYWDKRDIPFTDTETEFIREALSCVATTKVFQNAKFDLHMLRTAGFHVNGTIHDIAVLARLVYNDHMMYNLESQAKRYGLQKLTALAKSYIGKEVRRDFFGEEYTTPRYDHAPIAIMQEYAEADAEITLKLYLEYMKEMDPKSLPMAVTESVVTSVCYNMEWTGVKLDIPYIMRSMEHTKNLVAQQKEMFRGFVGVDYEPRPTVLKRAFKYCEDKWTYTDKGNPSFTDDVLAGFGGPVAECVREIRWLEKRISTYYKPFLNLMSPLGVLHPTMWQGGTRTGRFSYSDPNLQQVPKEDGDMPIRRAIVPRDGHCFVSMDYSQQEYRLMLAYANESELITKVMAGADLHQATADMVGVTRKQAKTLNFALLYGAGADKVAQMLGISVPEAKLLIARYFSRLPRVERFIKEVTATFKTRGYLYTWAGRKLQLSDPEFAYKGPNALIQGGGADICKIAMTKVAWTRCPILSIHDQLVFEMPLTNGQPDWSKVRELKEIMETVFPMKNGMAMKVDVSWSTVSLAEEDLLKVEL